MGYRTRKPAQRAPRSVEAAVRALLVCSLTALQRHHHPGRVLVTGDLCQHGKADTALIKGFCSAGKALQEATGQECVAYGYTHLENSASVVEVLGESGIELLRSDHYGPGGSVIWPLEHLESLRSGIPEFVSACAVITLRASTAGTAPSATLRDAEASVWSSHPTVLTGGDWHGRRWHDPETLCV